MATVSTHFTTAKRMKESIKKIKGMVLEIINSTMVKNILVNLKMTIMMDLVHYFSKMVMFMKVSLKMVCLVELVNTRMGMGL